MILELIFSFILVLIFKSELHIDIGIDNGVGIGIEN